MVRRPRWICLRKIPWWAVPPYGCPHPPPQGTRGLNSIPMVTLENIVAKRYGAPQPGKLLDLKLTRDYRVIKIVLFGGVSSEEFWELESIYREQTQLRRKGVRIKLTFLLSSRLLTIRHACDQSILSFLHLINSYWAPTVCQILCVWMKTGNRSVRSGVSWVVICSRLARMGPTERVTFEHRWRRGALSKVRQTAIITRTSTCLGLTPLGNEPYKALTLEFQQQSQICQPKRLMTQNNQELSHFPRSTPYFVPLPRNFFLTCKHRNVGGRKFFV